MVKQTGIYTVHFFRVHSELIRRAEAAEAKVAELERRLEKELERHVTREDDLIDRLLTRSGSRPIQPADEPLPVPSPSVTPLDEARRQDLQAEWLEHHNKREFDLTPDARRELEEFLEEEMNRPLIVTWPK